MRIQTPIAILICALVSATSWAEVKELSNTEMTEAYIKDGAIVIKQKAVAPTPKKKLKIRVGPGEPVTTERDTVTSANQQNTAQYTLFNEELNRDLSDDQLRTNQLNQTLSGISIPDATSPAQQAQQQFAQDIVRNGLGLPSDSVITPELMGQYMATFAGQSTGDPLGAQQSITNNGFQFSIPNPGGQFDPGVFPSGDNSMNIETTNQQLIFNLIFPKE